MEDARHCSVLYIRKYFVLHPLVDLILREILADTAEREYKV
jgi:hypothetical protein